MFKILRFEIFPLMQVMTNILESQNVQSLWANCNGNYCILFEKYLTNKKIK